MRFNYSFFGSQLRYKRNNPRYRKNKVGLRELSSVLGISTATLCRIENGTSKFDLDTFVKLVDWMGYSREDVCVFFKSEE